MSGRTPKLLRWIFITLWLFPARSVFAGDINWSGLYRIEGTQIQGSDLNGSDHTTSYGLHHLILKPTIVPADGFMIHSRFDLFNSSEYPNSQLGQFFGHGPGDSKATPTTATNSAQDSNALAYQEQAETIAVNELYLTYTHEFGQLLVGRAPLNFGLGITHNGGDGDFDHWLDNRDMIAYKVVIGNIFVEPMYGKVSSGPTTEEEGVTDYMLQAQYENPDTGLTIGGFYQLRVAGTTGNDTPETLGPNGTTFNNNFGNAPAGVNSTGFNGEFYNVFIKKQTNVFSVGVEAGFSNGKTGLQTQQTGGSYSEIGISGFGIAGELAYTPVDSTFSYDMKLGLATGDNPGDGSKYGGYVFNPNYQVAELMFNHPLGQYDILGTSAFRPFQGQYQGQSVTDRAAEVDTESVSNAVYISPNINKHFSDKFGMNTRFTYARLNQDPIAGVAVDRELGFELDIGATYKPFDRFTWKNTVALLWPGKGFAGGNSGYPTEFAYGLFTQAAIRF